MNFVVTHGYPKHNKNLKKNKSIDNHNYQRFTGNYY